MQSQSLIWSRSWLLPLALSFSLVMCATMGCRLALADPTMEPETQEVPASPETPTSPLTPQAPVPVTLQDPVPVTVTVEYPSDIAVTAAADEETKASLNDIKAAANLTSDLVVVLISLVGAILGGLLLFHFWGVVARG